MATRGRKRTKYSRRWRKWASTCKSGIFKRTGIRVNFKIEQLIELTPYACPCCKTPMESGGDNQSTSPTIDRINNDVGYELSNIWIICHRCNSMKRDAKTPNQLYAIADAWWDRITKCK